MSGEPLVLRTRLAAVPGLVRYFVVGLLSFVIDYETLTAVHRLLDAPLWVATSVGFWLSFVVNFALSRLWTFAESAGHPAGQLVRYSTLVAGNYAATVVVVSGLHALGLSILIAKALVVGTLTLSTFFTYKHWVFRDQRA